MRRFADIIALAVGGAAAFVLGWAIGEPQSFFALNPLATPSC